jgi:hypothetical protein
MRFFPFATASIPALLPPPPNRQSPLEWIPEALFPGIKWPSSEANHSLPSSAEVKNAWSYTSTPTYVFMACDSVTHSDSLIFPLPCYERDIWDIFRRACLRRESRDSSVGIALGYGLDGRGSRVRFPAGAENFSLHHRVQNGSGTHPASYPMGTRGSFPGG